MGVAWLRGIFPPIATAFTADGGLRPPPLGFFAHLRDGGLDGVVALGSNGEATHLTETERLQWIRSVRAGLPAPLRLIVGTGAESTSATIDRTCSAAAAGAEAALVIAPSYFARRAPAEPLAPLSHRVPTPAPFPILFSNCRVLWASTLGAGGSVAW